MALYRYVKSPPFLHQGHKNKLFSGFLVGLGIFILSIVLGSIGFYQLRANERFQKGSSFIFPISRSAVLGKSKEDFNSVIHTEARYWLPDISRLPFGQSKITHYNLSIPVLGIYQAVVEIGGEDLGKSMVHYPGTSLPGEVGNTVVFCHSVLPQFFNPKNYKTICSTLPTIEIGDEIIIFFDGIEYHYQVVEMIEVQPNDVSVLNQDMDSEFLSLITCVPPGTYLRRLIVKARLIY